MTPNATPSNSTHTDDELRCDTTAGGCDHGIAAHPVIILYPKGETMTIRGKKVPKAVFTSPCTASGCGCDGYVTPMPPDPSQPVKWAVAA